MPVSRSDAPAASATMSLASLSMRRAVTTMLRPTGVSIAPVALRSSKVVPSRCSRVRICWLRVGCDTFATRAASANDPVSAIVTRYSS